MKWSRFVLCGAFTASETLLVTQRVGPWITVPLGAFAAWWTYLCTRALWSEVSFRIAVWRLHQTPQGPTLEEVNKHSAARKRKRWAGLSNPKLDRLIDVGTVVGVLGFPAFLWIPLIFWLCK
jgi:hypothetical protein